MSPIPSKMSPLQKDLSPLFLNMSPLGLGSYQNRTVEAYCRSVFATIAHNRMTFLLFAVYKQVTQHSKLAKSNPCSYSSRFSKPFSDISRRCKELSFRETFQYSEKCLKVPKGISMFRVVFQSICLYLLFLFNGHV